MDLETFKQLVEQHDITYSYSDDASVWRRGHEQRERIAELAKQLPAEEVEAIWNAKVDRCLLPDYRQPFYWRRAA